ncbi:MAG: NUDIX hydrolase [Acidimicrobiales bacterium]
MPVVAAGGLLLRHGRTNGRGLEVALVHRPRYMDWSFPKGKLDLHESLLECALREVREETGLDCHVLSFAGTTVYQDRVGRPKAVGYWVMSPMGGGFSPNHEVDELRWLSVPEASELLTYDRDRTVLVPFSRRYEELLSRGIHLLAEGCPGAV